MDSPPNVKEVAIQLAQTASKTALTFYRFLPSDPAGELADCRRRLFEEYLTLSGVSDTVKALIEDNDKRKLKGSEEYIEHTRRLEEIWAPDGPMTECNQRMDRVLADLEKTLMDNAQSNRKPPWPIQQAAMAEEIERIQVYKKAITTAIHADFCESDREVDPKTQLATDIVTWLNILESSEKQRFMSRQRQAGTCRWIVDEKVCKPYHEWSSATEGFLWLRGKAGSGKSVLAAAVIDHVITGSLEEEEKKEKQKPNKEDSDESEAEELPMTALTQQEPYPDGFLAFFFCDLRDARTLRTPTILTSLFSQFLQVEKPDLAVTFPDLVQWYSDGHSPPADVETLQNLLLRAMRLHTKRTIIIDGLNECDDPPTLLHCFEKLLAEKNVRLFVTSRPEPVILAQYQDRPTINLEEYLEHASKDIHKSLVEQMIAHIRLQSIAPARKEKLADSMTQKSNGSFWYSQCALDSLYVCATVGQVHEMVAALPEHLDSLYNNILRGVHKRSTDAKTIVQMAVRWLGGTLRPMSMSQIIEAVKIELGATILNDDLTIVSEGDMLMICGDLVRLNERTASFGLAHSTVRAYLTQSPPEDKEQLHRYFFDSHDVHRDLALRSITYIMTEDIDKTICKSETLTYLFDTSKFHYLIDHCPMIPYVFDGGFEHLQHITQEDDVVIDLLTNLQKQIRERPEKYRRVLDSLHDHTGGTAYEWIIEEQELALVILVRFGPPWMVKRFLLRRPDLLKGEEKDKLLARVEKLGRAVELREVLVDVVKQTVGA